MRERGLHRHHGERGVLLQASHRGGRVQVCEGGLCLLERGVGPQAGEERIQTDKRRSRGDEEGGSSGSGC